MTRGAIRLVKMGGSLFDWPELGPRLWQWLQQQPPAVNYLVAGGGESTDALRRADGRYALGEVLSHRLCLDALAINGAILDHVLTAACSAPDASPDQQRKIAVLNVNDMLSSAELTARVPVPLPQTWQATSDSIAAYLAEAFGAPELVLLKSKDLAGSLSYAEAAQQGVVDDYFPIAAARRSMTRFVNLRNARFADWLLFR